MNTCYRVGAFYLGSKTLRAKLSIALALGALLVLPVLAQTLHSRAEAPVGAATITKSSGDTLLLPPSDGQIGTAGPLPSRGMTMAQVEKSHGAPEVRRSPVGDPPITRWEYSGFVVYFEYRHVIHSVAKVSR